MVFIGISMAMQWKWHAGSSAITTIQWNLVFQRVWCIVGNSHRLVDSTSHLDHIHCPIGRRRSLVLGTSGWVDNRLHRRTCALDSNLDEIVVVAGLRGLEHRRERQRRGERRQRNACFFCQSWRKNSDAGFRRRIYASIGAGDRFHMRLNLCFLYRRNINCRRKNKDRISSQHFVSTIDFHQYRIRDREVARWKLPDEMIGGWISRGKSLDV